MIFSGKSGVKICISGSVVIESSNSSADSIRNLTLLKILCIDAKCQNGKKGQNLTLLSRNINYLFRLLLFYTCACRPAANP
jgi:hypothetical protein